MNAGSEGEEYEGREDSSDHVLLPCFRHPIIVHISPFPAHLISSHPSYSVPAQAWPIPFASYASTISSLIVSIALEPNTDLPCSLVGYAKLNENQLTIPEASG
jgi:hypothetical protein